MRFNSLYSRRRMKNTALLLVSNEETLLELRNPCYWKLHRRLCISISDRRGPGERKVSFSLLQRGPELRRALHGFRALFLL